MGGHQDVSLLTCVSLRSQLAELREHREAGVGPPGAAPVRPAPQRVQAQALPQSTIQDGRCEEPSRKRWHSPRPPRACACLTGARRRRHFLRLSTRGS